MEGKYRVENVAKVWKPDDTLMAQQTNEWLDMDYEDVVDLEKVLAKFQESLTKLGEEKVEKKKKKDR